MNRVTAIRAVCRTGPEAIKQPVRPWVCSGNGPRKGAGVILALVLGIGAAAASLAAHADGDNSQPAAGPLPQGQVHSEGASMKRVTGIGGVFIKARDPVKLRAWYQQHLGIDVQAWGGTSFDWTDASGQPAGGSTAWMIGDGSNFAPSTSSYMINYRVADLHGLLKALRDEGCEVLDKVEESDYGKFGWVMDPEGNKIELWEPPAGA